MSRRRFVRPVGGSGIAAGAVGLAGCATDVGEEEGDEPLVEDPDDPNHGEEEVTLQIYSDADMEEGEDVTDALYEAGMAERSTSMSSPGRPIPNSGSRR